ncbi:hypothetical protein B7P34_09845 [Streptosporangium nondiastaticum]|uniref:Uncharacterized protein n=1 Tax=Streptosporangium nondiastaticum TaxID=35764 RepID=A0A9X7JSJ0_9ACTN|nr:hypothetical protein [Streptosporangium nondiastaticum]PSJ28906.1 hypothetical protein B7P34_09845 [Streptosporangium nondiastaticum]
MAKSKQRKAHWRIGYLFVHGIGNQKPGTTLEWGRSIFDALRDVYGERAVSWKDQPLTASPEDATNRHAEVVVSLGGAHHRTLFAEALWADKFTALGRPSIRRTLTFLVANIPLLFWVVGPDQRDLQVLFSPSRGLRDRGEARLAQMRLLWRLLTLAVISTALVYGILLATRNMLVSVLLLALLAWFVRSRRNLLWHVRVAAIDKDRTQRLLMHLHQKVEWMERHCDEVIVVAHSQGGYLMHRLLSRTADRRHPKVRRFIGVGSGLKPISLLKTFDDSGIRPSLWGLIGTAPAGLWGLGPWIWQPLGWLVQTVLRWLYLVLQMTVTPLSAFDDAHVAELYRGAFATEWHRTLATVPSLHLDLAHEVAVVASIAIASLHIRLIRAALQAHPPHPLGLDHHRCRIEWREYSSPHDMVGRMLGPNLPDKVEQPWIAPVGQPLSDHTMYFHRTGVLPRRLAADLLGDLGLECQADDWDQAVTWLDDVRRRHGARRRALHGLLIGTFATLLAAPQLFDRPSVLLAYLHAWLPLSLLLLSLTVLFSLLAHQSAHKAARHFTASLSGAAPSPRTRWRVRIVPPRPRLLPTIAAATGGMLAVYGTIRYFLAAREYGDTRIWQGYPFLMPMGIGLLIIACASAAGYPVRARWYLGIAGLGCMALYSSPAPAALGSPWELRAEGTLLGILGGCLLVGLAGSFYARLRAVDLTTRE